MEDYGVKKVFLYSGDDKILKNNEISVLNSIENITGINLSNYKSVEKSIFAKINFAGIDSDYKINTKILNINDNIKLALMTFEEHSDDYFLQLLIHDKGEQKVSTYINDEKIGEYSQKASQIDDIFSKEYEQYEYNTDILPQLSVPCIQKGCCTFGSMKFNWCGAGCGSGTPINSLDRCCRSHDYCYGSYKSYPDRCTCDQTLINCASSTSNGYKHLITGTFVLKRKLNGC